MFCIYVERKQHIPWRLTFKLPLIQTITYYSIHTSHKWDLLHKTVMWLFKGFNSKMYPHAGKNGMVHFSADIIFLDNLDKFFKFFFFWNNLWCLNLTFSFVSNDLDSSITCLVNIYCISGCAPNTHKYVVMLQHSRYTWKKLQVAIELLDMTSSVMLALHTVSAEVHRFTHTITCIRPMDADDTEEIYAWLVKALIVSLLKNSLAKTLRKHSIFSS